MNKEHVQEMIKQWRHQLHISVYRVERAFDKMPQDEKEIIFALASIEKEHLINTSIKPRYLRDFTENGQMRIAKAYRKIREISNRLPTSISLNEFLKIDKEVNYERTN